MQNDKKNNESEKKDKKSPLFNYAKYSSIAFQMLVVIGAGVFGGVKLDQWTGLNFPVFTIVLSLASVAVAIYLSVKDFLE